MDYKKLISKGKSVREFKHKEVKVKYFEEIKEYMQQSKKLIPEIETELKYFSKQQVYTQLRDVVGYNGYIINSPNYIVLLSEVKDGYIENSGYIGEKIILKARDLKIDSCWITIHDSNAIKSRLNIKSDKEVTAIISLGYEDKKFFENKKSTSQRLGVEEIVYLNEWGNNITSQELEEKGLLDAFSYARMAPSTLNRQPWRFIIDNENIVVAMRKDECTSEYERKIDIGISMLYFSLIIDITIFDLKWNLKNLDNNYNIPSDYEIVGYCCI